MYLSIWLAIYLVKLASCFIAYKRVLKKVLRVITKYNSCPGRSRLRSDGEWPRRRGNGPSIRPQQSAAERSLGFWLSRSTSKRNSPLTHTEVSPKYKGSSRRLSLQKAAQFTFVSIPTWLLYGKRIKTSKHFDGTCQITMFLCMCI